MGSDSSYTVGYKYLLGMHMALCYGPINSLKRITVGDRVAWSGSIDSSQTLTITDAHELFGGDEREGGVGSWPIYQTGTFNQIGDSGTGGIDVLMGEDTQIPNEYLISKAGQDQPAYRGITSLVFKKFFYSSINPYIKSFSFRVARFYEDWYSVKAIIGQDMNPAHIIYECLTNSTWGLGYPPISIDEDSFIATADTLFNESFGVSMLWGQQSSLEDFIVSVLTHVNGAVNSDPATGKFLFTLIRDDYDVNTLKVFDTSNVIELKSFERRTWGETINEVTVVYKDGTTEKNTPITVQDVAHVRAQGQVINQTTTYAGIRNETLAARIASRDLRTASSPLAKLKLIVNRQAYGLLPGGVFKFSWSPLGIDSVVFRISAMDFGSINDKTIVIEAIEDVFGLPLGSYSEQEPVGWSPPDYSPQPITKSVIIEAPYYLIETRLTDTEIAGFGPDFGFGLVLASEPNGFSLSYDIYDDISNYNVGHGSFTASAYVAVAMGREVTTLVYKSGVNLGLSNLSLILVGGEWMEVTNINTTLKELTVVRSVLDSMPVSHNVDEELFTLYSGGYDTVERSDGEIVNYKLLAKSSGGTYPEASAAVIPLTFDNRYQRPYPTANVKQNTELWPVSIIGGLTLTWAHRDKTQQLADFLSWFAASVSLEEGITYSLDIYGEDDTLVKVETGLLVDSYTYNTEEEDLNKEIPIFYPWPLIQGEPLPPNPYGVSPRDSSFDLALSETDDLIITNNNMTAEGTRVAASYAIGNEPIDIEEGGKFYFEFKFDSTPYAWSSVGLWCVAHGYPNGMIGYGDGGYGLQANGYLMLDKIAIGTVGPTCYNGYVIGVYIDFDAGTYQASVNGTLISGTLYACNFNDGPYYPAYSAYIGGDKATMRTSYKDMLYRPLGFKPWDNDIPGITEVTTLDSVLTEDNITLSGGLLTATTTALSHDFAVATVGRFGAGRYYFEVILNNAWAVDNSIGVVGTGFDNTIALGRSVSSFGYEQSGKYSFDSVDLGALGASYSDTDVVGVAIDFDNSTVEFFINGVSQEPPISVTFLDSKYFPAFSLYATNDQGTLVTDAASLTYLPNGFVSWDNEEGSGVGAPPTQYRSNSKLRTAVKTTDGTLDSRQTYDHTFDRAGYGYNYGKYYGGKA